MNIELYEIRDFLTQYPPFNTLPVEALDCAVSSVEVSYYRAGSDILRYGDRIHHLYVIRSGAVEIYRRNGSLYNRLEQGDIFGQMGLLMNNLVRLQAKAIEDTLVYRVAEDVFHDFCAKYEDFSDFVEVENSTRLHQAVTTVGDNDMTTAKVKNVLSREPVVISGNTTIQLAAQTMAEQNVSAVLVGEKRSEFTKKNRKKQIFGILTDRDLCNRILATGLSYDTPVDEVMTTELLTLDHNAYVYEAMLLMLRCNIKHLPIMKDRWPVGVVELTDIVRYESQNSLLLVNSIFQQPSVEDLEALSHQVKDCFVRMVNEDANSHMVGSAMAVIGRSFIQRLTELAEEELGAPPVPYCFLTFGSMARDEQLCITDQDNGLMLDNAYDSEKDGTYFSNMSEFVCKGLVRCGYDKCTGNIMATNPEWRKTRAEWEHCFGDWIENPNPQALLNSSIFFDLEGVCGEVEWAEKLQDFVVERTGQSKRFLACLARNSLGRTPPLGFFKNFVMEKDGRHRNSINLKRRGTAPLSDIVRVHALAVGSDARNTFERLDDIIEAGIIPEGRGPDLRDAMEFISLVRLRHQVRDLEEGVEPENTIDPADMSEFERRHLKDAFQILNNAQNFVKYLYHSTNR